MHRMKESIQLKRKPSNKKMKKAPSPPRRSKKGGRLFFFSPRSLYGSASISGPWSMPGDYPGWWLAQVSLARWPLIPASSNWHIFRCVAPVAPALFPGLGESPRPARPDADAIAARDKQFSRIVIGDFLMGIKTPSTNEQPWQEL